MSGASLFRGKPVKANMKEKIIIYSVSKDEGKSIWTFNKKQKFIPSLLDFLLKLGFNDRDLNIAYYFAIPQNDKYEHEIPKEYLTDPFCGDYLPIDSFNDTLFQFNKTGYDIELIFFTKRIVLIIRTDEKKSHKIGKLIKEFASFVEPKK